MVRPQMESSSWSHNVEGILEPRVTSVLSQAAKTRARERRVRDLSQNGWVRPAASRGPRSGVRNCWRFWRASKVPCTPPLCSCHREEPGAWVGQGSGDGVLQSASQQHPDSASIQGHLGAHLSTVCPGYLCLSPAGLGEPLLHPFSDTQHTCLPNPIPGTGLPDSRQSLNSSPISQGVACGPHQCLALQRADGGKARPIVGEGCPRSLRAAAALGLGGC